jgi:transcriptional regulator with XRE-family HTH domain
VQGEKRTPTGKKAQNMQDMEKIKEALQDRVVSSVAEATGLNRRTVSEIKAGKRTTASRSTIKLLSLHLGLSDDE